MKYEIELLKEDIRGLSAYHNPYKWSLSPNKQSAYFSALGVLISINKRDNETMFKAEIEYDYIDPDKENKFEYCKSGTFGTSITALTMEQAMEDAETYIFDTFQGIQETYTPEHRPGEARPFTQYRNITPKVKVSRFELAEMAFMHHYGCFDLLNTDFRKEILNKSPKELKDKFNNILNTYKNRSASETKYSNKLKEAFEDAFKMELRPFISNFRFNLLTFERALGTEKMKLSELLEVIGPKKHNIIKHCIKYWYS